MVIFLAIFLTCLSWREMTEMRGERWGMTCDRGSKLWALHLNPCCRARTPNEAPFKSRTYSCVSSGRPFGVVVATTASLCFQHPTAVLSSNKTLQII